MTAASMFRTPLLLAGAVTLALASTVAAAEINVELEAGLGYDSNAFRAPGSAYHDMAQAPINPAGNLADPNNYPLVTPDEKAGLFVPLGLKAERVQTDDGGSSVILSYDFTGSAYLTGDTSNANTYIHKAKAGYELLLDRKGKRKNSLYMGAFVTSKDKTYTDRDTGLVKTSSGGTDISNRFSYLALGLEAKYNQRIGAIQYGADASIESRDYSDPVAVSQYDHNRYQVGAYTGFKLAKPTKLKLSLDYEIQDYDSRKARDLATASLTGHPTLSYSFLSLDATLRHKLSKQWTVYLGYTLVTRTDDFEGYNDYTSNGVDARVIYRRDRFKGKLSAGYTTRSYDNAFAFENPNGVAKDYDTLSVKLSGNYDCADNMAMWAEASYYDVGSTDTRFEYSRNQLSTGVRWLF